ncbi:trypsin-like peptidase domain-containing protein [Fretibacter rubidus]|uniref:trypsin-like peptidase domain-containing protein n=1 Tax=Fretibacter rubidus TaxID=570162 RepID=UPI00352A4E39
MTYSSPLTSQIILTTTALIAVLSLGTDATAQDFVVQEPTTLAKTTPAATPLTAPMRSLSGEQGAIPPQSQTSPDRQQQMAIVDNRMGSAQATDIQSPSTMPLGFPFSYPSETSLADLVEQVSPAVVNIIATSETMESTTEGQGSGFLISAMGEVVTNYHVIDGGTLLEVEFNNGERFPAKVIGTDEETDIAVLKIDAKRAFPFVKFHKGEALRIGDWVVAIGNPFGIGQSTSFGIISAIGRERVESGSYVDYVQTDATINTGNSGGPLFNPAGDVVGINSAIYSPTGASVGIGFSIPHNTAAEVVNAIRTEGRVRRGWLGAGLRTAEKSKENIGVFESGATINNVVGGSPADIYGLQVDDIILNINGQTVRDATEATRIIGRLRPNQKMNVTYERGEKTYQLTVMIAERPDKDVVEKNVVVATPPPTPTELGQGSNMGWSLVDLSSEARSALGMRYDQVGVYVEAVAPGSKAANAGVKANMVIMQADSRDIPSVPAFNHMIGQAQTQGSGAMILFVRESTGRETYLTLQL